MAMSEPTEAEAIKRHYGSAGLAQRILHALTENGEDVSKLSAAMLYPLDQLHGRQLAATAEHLARLDLTPEMHVLDVGSGIGGPARYMVATFGCRVTGIDLTEEFVAAARELTERCGLAGRVAFEHGNALAMPFADASFDAASCQYVAMNIADKTGLLREIRRVLKPGGRLVWSSVVLVAGEPHFPVPWAREPAGSFLVSAEALRPMFAESGLRIIEWTDETEVHKAFSAKMRAAPPPPVNALSNRIVIGSDFMERVRNLNRSFDEGRVGTVLVVCER
jgi:SAM-dependent methyltransferase